MLPSLSLRLVVGFGIAIVFTLALASIGTMVLLRDQQIENAQQRYGRLADPFAYQVQQMELVGWPTSRIRAELLDRARYYDVRLVLLDSEGRVVVDTDEGEELLGSTISVPPREEALDDLTSGMQPFMSWQDSWNGQDVYAFTSVSPPPIVPAGVPLIQPQAKLIVAVPAGDVTDAWAQLLPGQAAAGGVALAFAALFGIVLAERITRPVRQMTRASMAIARGNYDQRIDATGSDEIGQLARAFNEMASEVGRSQCAMRQLLGNVSHDLKTPLTSIQGFSQAIMDGMAADAEETKQLASVIHDEAEHMGALVEDLLYLSRIESGELTLQTDLVDLDALLTASARRLRFQAESNEVTVRLAVGAGTIQADGRRLEQVFANLLDNAIRFAPAGTEVLVRSYRAGARVGVEVHNGGEPISEKDLPHVFDRFYQGDPSRKRGHAGLGLAIVHELVHAHGGEVVVQSAKDSGTTFTVWLPQGADGPESVVVTPPRSRVPRAGRIASRVLHRESEAPSAPLAPGESERAGT